jgi:hypothetical protein
MIKSYKWFKVLENKHLNSGPLVSPILIGRRANKDIYETV